MTEKRKISRTIRREIADLQSRGVALPKHDGRKVEAVQQYRQMVASGPGKMQEDVNQHFAQQASSKEVQGIQQNADLIRAVGRQRMASSQIRTASSSDIAAAIPRFYDPLEYWDLSGLPWNMADEGHRHKLHKWLRLFYATHYLIPILVDIFTRFPLVGMHLYSKDKQITAFYEKVFLDDLKYEDFLVRLGREYWTVGEAFPMGSFNESLGVWEREELIQPEDVVIEQYPILGTRQLKVRPPEHLRRLATTKSPSDEYKQLNLNFPDLIPYLMRGEPFPVSDVMLKHVGFMQSDWDDHGTPILLRALRTLLHEEKLLASQDAIAERLYSPLILAKLGVNDMGGNQGPWIPGPDQLDSFRDDMDVALSSDFRLMVYHYALEVQNVFGREQVPDLGNDFDRVERRLMQVFGINPSLLSGGSNSQPYASSALQAEFMNQILRTFQAYLKDHFKSRALVVAEAQGHYDYEKRGQTRVPIMEEVVEFDEDGKPYITERHRLLVPELEMETLDLRDEATERQFLQNLRAMGVPISDQRMMVGINFDFKDSLDELSEEMIQKTVAQQHSKLQAYKIMQAQGIPIPADLKAEVESTNAPAPAAGGAPGGDPMGGGMGAPGGGMGMPPAGGGGAPGGTIMPPPPAGLGGGAAGGAVQPLQPGPAGSRPQISDEARPGTPVAASKSDLGRVTQAARRVLASSDQIAHEFPGLTMEELDERIAGCKTILDEIEWRKRMRRSSKREVIRDEEPELEWDLRRSAAVWVDLVPPAFRDWAESNEDEDDTAPERD